MKQIAVLKKNHKTEQSEFSRHVKVVFSEQINHRT